MTPHSKPVAAVLASLVLLAGAASAQPQQSLPDPDGKPADMTKPVQVFILMGQSNMLGFGKIAGNTEGSLEHAVKSKGLYPYLIDDAGNWTVRKDVRNVRVMNFKDYTNEWMTISGRAIGPEIGIGHHVGEVLDAPVLILKSCIGNRSLGWDLLPPGSEPYESNGKMIPGYRGTPDDPRGNGQKVEGKWYAGKQYDDDTDSAKKVLANLQKYYPGAKSYEVAGFLFWQGAKDGGSDAHAQRYEFNLVNFIKALRKDFDAPDALFVVATMGHGRKGGGGRAGTITDAQLAVDGRTGRYPEFKGNVATFYSNPVSKGGSANGHYGGNAETYMNVGEGMGRAMAALLKHNGGGKSNDKATKTSTKEAIPMPEGLNAEEISVRLRPALQGLSKRKYAAVWRMLDRIERINSTQQAAEGADTASLEAEQESIKTIRTFLDGLIGSVLEGVDAYVAAGNPYRANELITENNRFFRGIKKYDTPTRKIQSDYRKAGLTSVIRKGAQFYQLLANAQNKRDELTLERLATFANTAGDNVYGNAAKAAVAALKEDPKAELDADELVAAQKSAD